MKHILISSVKSMSSRWQEAFPQGERSQLDNINHNSAAIIWLDLSTRTTQEKEDLLRRTVALGKSVVALSTAPTKQEAKSVVRLGAKGYGHLLAAPEQFRQMAAVVSNGGYWLGEGLVSEVIQQTIDIARSDELQQVDDGRSLLTERECAVANEIARGASNREIAETLQVSERTVKAHLSAIFEKLQLRDRVQLALKLNRITF
jgi:DNA-binding NarL/FixJ family response regulator